MADYVPLIIVGAVAYYVLVVNPNFISDLMARLSPSSSTPSTPPGSPCMGTDANNQPCTCDGSTATSSVAYAYYGGGKGKSKKGKGGKKKGKGGGGGGKAAADNTPASTCNCSACNQSTNTSPASTLAQNIQKNVKKNIKNVTGNVGTVDINAFAGHSIADEGYGFKALQAYYRRGW